MRNSAIRGSRGSSRPTKQKKIFLDFLHNFFFFLHKRQRSKAIKRHNTSKMISKILVTHTDVNVE